MGLIVSSLRSCLASEALEALIYCKINWHDSLYTVDYQAPRTAAAALPFEEAPDSEGENDYVVEEEPLPDFEQLAEELSRPDIVPELELLEAEE